MVYIVSNEKKVSEGQKLTFALQAQDGSEISFSLHPRFVHLQEAGSSKHNFGAAVNDDLPDGVEFTYDYTTVLHKEHGTLVRGGMNEAVVEYKGESFPLFQVLSCDEKPDSGGTLYFQGMAQEFGGGPIKSYQANPSHHLE